MRGIPFRSQKTIPHHEFESKPVTEASDLDKRDWIFPRVWAALLLLLLAVTWRIWLPIGVLPDVPLLGWPPVGERSLIVISLQAVVMLALLGSILAIMLRRGGRYRLWGAVSTCLVIAFCFDQLRMQPWAYQSVIYGLVFASMRPVTAHRWLVPLAASVYIYSAAGKFDYQFAHTVGQDFLFTASDFIDFGRDTPAGDGGRSTRFLRSLDPATRASIALLFPACEMLIGLALLWKRTRRIGGYFAVAMHASLFALLGPWGLAHSLGVLVWNAALAIQAYFLFIDRRWDRAGRADEPAAAARPWSATGLIARAAVTLALLAPLAERRDRWDHWLSWALYSPHSSRVVVEIHHSEIDSLPRTARHHLAVDENGDGWRELKLDAWSLEAMGVPIYPQARYQLGLTVAIAQRLDSPGAIRAILRGVSDRWTGRRDDQRLIGLKELEQAADRYWLGGQAEG